MRRTITKAALVIGLLSALAGSLSADDTAIDKLPEPALRFAKDASLRVTEMEQEWQTLSETLRKSRSDFVPPNRRQTDASLREEATKVLSAAKSLLHDEGRMPTTIEQFREALKKSAVHYREVAALHLANAESAKTPEVKDDYRELAMVYESKALSATERAAKLPVAVTTKTASEVVTEGNLFIERLLESLSVGPVTDSERDLFLVRLRKHGERCQTFSDELSRGVELLLKGSAASGSKHSPATWERYGTASTPSGTLSSGSLQDDARSIVGTIWSSPITLHGNKYQQRILLRPDGTCTQVIYSASTTGFGPLLLRRSYTYELDSLGNLVVFSGGKLLEAGKVTVKGEASWVYDIVENVADPSLSTKRITFDRYSAR